MGEFSLETRIKDAFTGPYHVADSKLGLGFRTNEIRNGDRKTVKQYFSNH